MKKKILSILCTTLVTVVLTAGWAMAADYPAKPIKFLIPFGAGGSADLMGRALANGTEGELGQPIVPINRPGAGGGIICIRL